MAAKHEFIDQGDYLLVVSTGEILSHEEMTAHALAVIDAARSRSHYRILITGNDLGIDLTPYDTIEFAKTMEKIELAMTGLRIATISSSPNVKARSFIETTLINRGVGYRTFRSTDEALQWLRM